MTGTPDTRPFRTHVRDEGGASVLALAGELDIAAAPVFELELQQLERAGDGPIVLDVSELEFLDSTGIRLVFEASRRARETGRRLTIRGITPPVRRTFTLVGLIEVLPLEE